MGFFDEKPICFDIRQNFIKFIYGSRENSNIVVEKYGYVNLEDRHLEDGLINLNDETVKIMKNIMPKNNIQTNIAKVNLWHSAVSLRIVKIPYMPEADLELFMDAEIKRLLPQGLEDSVYDYKILEELDDGEKQFYSLMITSFPKKIKERLLNFFQRINLKLTALDVYPNTVGRVYSFNKKENVAIADINGNNLDFLIVNNGKIFMYSNILLDDFAGVGTKGDTEKINFLKDEMVLYEIMKPINSFISSYLNYFSSRRSGKQLDKMYLLGGISELENMDIHLTNRFGIVVERGLPSNIKVPPEADMRHYVGALGLLLRDDE